MGDDSGPMPHPSSSPLQQLPKPDADALAASSRLVSRIQSEIAARGGWISFADYMQLALYAPGLGYYTGGAAKFGPGGDFVTAPSLGPLFAQTIARQVAELMETSAPRILEFGAGGGELAGDLLAELSQMGCAVESYSILEPGAELRVRQQAAIEKRAAANPARVAWLDRLPEGFNGVMIANEVADAMPVRALAWRAEGIFERGVSFEDGLLAWAERPAAGEVLDAALAMDIGPPYASEIGLDARAWMSTVAGSLGQGALLVFDYGFPAREFYHPQRDTGTLMAHYRHHAHADPFFHPGLQDLTTHVDFSAMAASAQGAGAQVLGYTTQSHFLVNCGITDVLDRTDAADARSYAPLASMAQKLMSPAEMGELFKVLCVGRGIDRGIGRGSLVGFARGDRSHTL